MASLLNLRDYGADSESDIGDEEDLVQHLKPIESGFTVSQDLQIVVSPEVTSTVRQGNMKIRLSSPRDRNVPLFLLL